MDYCSNLLDVYRESSIKNAIVICKPGYFKALKYLSCQFCKQIEYMIMVYKVDFPML